MATATVIGEVLGTPNETMRAQRGGERKPFTPGPPQLSECSSMTSVAWSSGELGKQA
jgi:hypothetical protein